MPIVQSMEKFMFKCLSKSNKVIKNHRLKYNLKGDFFMKKIRKAKIIYILLIIIIVFSNFYIVLADDEEEEEEIEFNWEEEIIQTAAKSSNEPKINSRAAIVFDRNSKKVIYEKNSNQKKAMASTTKIMTSLIVIEKAKLSDVVTVSKKAAGIGGSRLDLKTGDKVTVRDLLYGLMLRSGNDSAVALAEYVGGSVRGFADLMNQKAKELNLNSTNFVTPHGLDDNNHYTTAYELARLTDYALQNKTFCNIVATKNCTITINGCAKSLNNTNELLGNLNGVYGVKTGFTNNAGRCLVTSIKRGDLDLICVVLGADTKKQRTQDSIQLIEYSFKNYEMVDLQSKIKKEFAEFKEQIEKKIFVNKGKEKQVEISLEQLENSKIPLQKGLKDTVYVKFDCNQYYEAPLEANKEIGKMEIYINNQKEIELKIYNQNEIEKKTIKDYFLELLESYKRLSIN